MTAKVKWRQKLVVRHQVIHWFFTKISCHPYNNVIVVFIFFLGWVYCFIVWIIGIVNIYIESIKTQKKKKKFVQRICPPYYERALFIIWLAFRPPFFLKNTIVAWVSATEVILLKHLKFDMLTHVIMLPQTNVCLPVCRKY